LESIAKLSKEYKEDALKIDKLFSILYVSMISEEQQVFFHSDEHIPNGKEYEVQCPYCKSLLKRKKI
jgi:hypothetical protein